MSGPARNARNNAGGDAAADADDGIVAPAVLDPKTAPPADQLYKYIRDKHGGSMLAVDASRFYAAHPHIPRTLLKANKKMVGSNRDKLKWLENDGPGGSRIGIVAGYAPVESGPDPAVASAKSNSGGSATV